MGNQNNPCCNANFCAERPISDEMRHQRILQYGLISEEKKFTRYHKGSNRSIENGGKRLYVTKRSKLTHQINQMQNIGANLDEIETALIQGQWR